VGARRRLAPGPADPCAAASVARQSPQLSARRRIFRSVASAFTPVTGAITAFGRAPSASAQAVTASAARTTLRTPGFRGRRAARRSSPRPAGPAAPITAVRTAVPPAAACTCRVGGRSWAGGCPAPCPRGPVRIGSRETSGAGAAEARPPCGTRATRRPGPPESTARTAAGSPAAGSSAGPGGVTAGASPPVVRPA
jgi:hypothetical protein